MYVSAIKQSKLSTVAYNSYLAHSGLSFITQLIITHARKNSWNTFITLFLYFFFTSKIQGIVLCYTFHIKGVPVAKEMFLLRN